VIYEGCLLCLHRCTAEQEIPDRPSIYPKNHQVFEVFASAAHNLINFTWEEIKANIIISEVSSFTISHPATEGECPVNFKNPSTASTQIASVDHWRSTLKENTPDMTMRWEPKCTRVSNNDSFFFVSLAIINEGHR
jgi:hypothetical protein